jgi:tRNA pseudouridine38-40 synthase
LSESPEANVPRFLLTLAYDGTDFCGWQRQEPLAPDASALPSAVPDPASLIPPSKIVGTLQREGEPRPRLQLRTVQHVLEVALRHVLREPIETRGSSRTDAGVHAKGQLVAFTCSGDIVGDEPAPRERGWPLDRGADRLVKALNGRLPDDVVVLDARPVPEGFDPVTRAAAKAYSYTIHASGTRPLWDRRFVHQVWETLDLEAMQAAAAAVVGEHDFAAFAAAGHGRQTTVRTIFGCSVTRASPDRLRIDVSGNGFLWNMVRILAGTLVDVGRGRLSPADVPAILTSRDRAKAGPTLPPTGLCLEWIRLAEETTSMPTEA